MRGRIPSLYKLPDLTKFTIDILMHQQVANMLRKRNKNLYVINKKFEIEIEEKNFSFLFAINFAPKRKKSTKN